MYVGISIYIHFWAMRIVKKAKKERKKIQQRLRMSCRRRDDIAIDDALLHDGAKA